MTIHELTLEHELVLLSNEVRPRPKINRPRTILVKILEFTASDEINYHSPGSTYHKGWLVEFRKTFKALLCKIDNDMHDSDDNMPHDVEIIEGMSDRKITVHNFRYNVPTINGYYLAHLVGEVYVIDNHTCFEEFL